MSYFGGDSANAASVYNGSICFTSAMTLRCVLLPTYIFLYHFTSMDKSDGVLIAESWTMLVTCGTELTSHLVAGARDNLKVARGFDFTIGAASNIPLALYTLYLYLFLHYQVFETLPIRLRKIGRFIFVLAIPVIVFFNAAASFAGVTVQNIGAESGKEVFSANFIDDGSQSLWRFFSAVALAVLTIYQGSIFFLGLYFLFHDVIMQNRRATLSATEKHSFVWQISFINVAVQIGEIETVTGFGGGGFSLSITRRVLRLVSRILLCFRSVSRNKSQRHKRLDTDRNDGDDAMQLALIHKKDSVLSTVRPGDNGINHRTEPKLSTLSDTERLRTSNVNMRQSTATLQDTNWRPDRHISILDTEGIPTIRMRFPSVDIPSPSLTLGTLFEHSRHPSSGASLISSNSLPHRHQRSSSLPPSPSFGAQMSSRATRARRTLSKKSSRSQRMHHRSGASQFTMTSEMLVLASDLAARFPGTPVLGRMDSVRGEGSGGMDGSDTLSIHSVTASSECCPSHILKTGANSTSDAQLLP
ncbi:hypothetical protein BDQ12DRAFT_727033 [Crucibulum laeve]|uniref:Uncharacterized protein n=1 Tax=Crucibulum laeve TaxID=68775 RepID=A0A5C3LMY9_9AGAR|nr:hypothetical protein BDQ12DRAFT_727033 [Crucibulum laeve]